MVKRAKQQEEEGQADLAGVVDLSASKPPEPVPVPVPEEPAPEEEKKLEEKPKGFGSLVDEMQEMSDQELMEKFSNVNMDDLIGKGFVQQTLNITESFSFTIRTLLKKEELDVKRRISDYDGAQIYVLDETNANTLAYCLIALNGTMLPDEFEKRREVLDNMSDALLVSIIHDFRDLNKALVVLLKGSSKNSLARHLLGPELT